MGEVYLAEDPTLQRHVALKVLSTIDAKSKRRFVREGITASQLSHPNVAVVYEAGEADGTAFIAMQYVEGETLRDRLLRGSMDIRAIVALAREVADALDDAHRRGIIHRDIKPGNIMIDSRGHAKVVDFGIAKVLELDDPGGPEASTAVAETAAGNFVGTLQYVSPEQASGGAVDGRSDIFSFGIVLYEMLTGTNPFAAPNFFEIVRRIRELTPPPIERSDCPPELKRIVAKCLEKDPDRRYQTARDLVLDLESSGGPPASPVRRRRSATPALILASLAAVVVVVGFLAFRHRGAAVVSASPSRIDSIAVLPFANFSPDQKNDYIGDGITEEVINGLAQLNGLKVVSRTSVFGFKGTHADVREIGKTLGVDAVVEGSVQRANDQLRVTAQLINAHDGYHLWSQTYSGAVADVFSIEDQIARSVASALQRQITPQAVAAPMTHDMTAYDLYTRARHEETLWTKANFDDAVALYRAAIDRDPNFAEAYAGLAETYSLMDHRPGLTTLPESEIYRLAIEYATRALAIAPQSADAHAALGHIDVHLGRFEESRQELQRALQINPNLSSAILWEAALQRIFHQNGDVIRSCRRARELDPESSLVMNVCDVNLWDIGEYGMAADFARRGTEVDPEYIDHRVTLARAYVMLGRFDDADAVLRRAADLHPSVRILDEERALMLGVMGRRAEAVSLLRSIQTAGGPFATSPFMMRAWAAAGETSEALRCVDALLQRIPNYLRLSLDLPPHPAFAAFVNHPHVHEVRRKLGLPD